MSTAVERVLRQVEEAREEIVQFAAQLVRIPTVNPPGEHYRECAETIGRQLVACGFEVELIEATGRPEHTAQYPRVNVVGTRRSSEPGPTVHLNGHFDVVPAGGGWSLEPFGGEIRDGRLYGRGSADMKGGIAAALFAAEALRRAGVSTGGTIEISGTVDEESGGFAGVAHLAEIGRIAAGRTDYVIIPEPLDPDRICVGHRGVWWHRLTVRGKMAHGSMPFLGVNAIDKAAALLERIRREIDEGLQRTRTSMPIEPPEARRATLNVNAIQGGQFDQALQTPCVADRCEIVLDRRFLPEETLDEVRAQVQAVLAAARAGDPDLDVELEDLLVVEPVRTPSDSPLIAALDRSVREVLGRPAECIASPGTYDHKHVARIAGIEHCVAYGPGRLVQAHQADEWCGVQDLVDATKVLALTLLELLQPPP